MRFLAALFFILLLFSSNCYAHFGLLTASPPMLDNQQQNQLELRAAFCHPRAATGMDMEKPAVFAVYMNGVTTDLLPALQETPLFNHKAWSASFKATLPGDYIFYMSPQPYWEEAEQCFIVHHSKVVVNAYDMQQGWDSRLDLPVEIMPLTRPYGIYAGNSFIGQVLHEGKPLANCKVEVEFYDPQQQKPAANEAFTTQVVLTDKDGYFSWSFPWAGWWGFSALTSGGQITHNNKTAELEIGGVLWLYIDQQPGK